ncbi:MAG: two-component regulator propeller domain-containing protein [Bacteroidia bacterium]
MIDAFFNACKKLHLLLFIFSACSTVLYSQHTDFRFDHLELNDDLSNSFIWNIAQSGDGVLWIATTDGLNKYDGYSLTSYHNNQQNSSSLPNNYITKLLSGTGESIWIGTLNGLSRYNSLADNFFNFLHSDSIENSISDNFITHLAKDKQGSLWIGTHKGGLNKLITGNSGTTRDYSFIHFMTDITNENSISSNNIFDIVFDAENTGWVCTSKGVDKFTEDKSGNVTFEHILNNKDLGGSAYTLALEADTLIWIASDNGTLLRIPLNKPLVKTIVSNYRVNLPIMRASEKRNFIYTSASYDTEGVLWFGTSNEGVIRIDTKKLNLKDTIGAVSIYRHIPNNSSSIIGDQVNQVFKDQSGSLWFCTDVGVSILHRQKQVFKSLALPPFIKSDDAFTVYAINEKNEQIVVGTDDYGLFFFSKDGKFLSNIGGSSSQEKIKTNGIASLNIGANGTIFAGTFGGLNIFEENPTGKYHVKNFLNQAGKDERRVEIYCIQRISDAEYWCGTQTGIYILKYSASGLTYSINAAPFLKNEIVVCMVPAKSETVWIGTTLNGVYLIGKNGAMLKHFSAENTSTLKLADNTINALFTDNTGNLWLGTNGGLHRYDQGTNDIYVYTTQSNLPRNVINGILQDNTGLIWCSTSKGLSRFNQDNKTFTNFDQHDGLLSNDFIKGACYKDKKGMLYFGSNKGVVFFNPAEITTNRNIPKVIFTDFKIFENSVFNNDTSIRRQILKDKKLDLSFRQNFFSIEFAALNFVNPENNRYKYILEGFDKEWINAGNRRSANYTNVSPGCYTFKVIASNNSGVWNNDAASLAITVTPVFNQTWWFRLLISFLAASLILYIYRQRIRTIELKKEAEISEHSAQMKEQFLANMSHEIRTPLNAISGMTNLLLKHPTVQEQSKYLNAIRLSSENLNVIINDILDFSKIEAGKISIEHTDFSVIEVLENLRHTLQHKAEQQGTVYSVIHDLSLAPYFIGDPVRLSQILINLTGNSLKFTSKGYVSVFCKPASDTEVNLFFDSQVKTADAGSGWNYLYFEVKDSGIGIPPDKIDKIFESFTQASSDTTRKFGGTGLGLSITKRLVDLQKGKLKVESRLNEGSKFSFIIPYQYSDKTSEYAKPVYDHSRIVADLRGIRILLAEDNEFNRIVAIDTLRNEIQDLSIDIAENGKIAIEKLKNNHYDLILMDVQMPELDGLEATKIIRSQFPAPVNQIPILAMTAGALKSETHKCIASGMNDFITKPIVLEEFLIKISLYYKHFN